MPKRLFLFVPRYLPDLTYGGPTISTNALWQILSQDHKNILFIITSSCKKVSEAMPVHQGIYRGNLLAQIRCFNYLRIGGNTDGDVLILNSFFHPQSIIVVLFLCISSLVKRNNCSVLVAPRAELMPRGEQRLTSRFLKAIWIFFYSKIAYRILDAQLLFTSVSEYQLSCHKRLSYSNYIILPNIPTDISSSTVSYSLSVAKSRFLSFRKSQILKICFLGRVSEEKGIGDLIDCLSDLDSSISIDLNVYGQIGDRSLRIINSANNATSKHINVIFHGLKARSELSEFILGNHISIFPSRGENYCHALAECLSCCLPTFFSNIPYWSDFSSCLQRERPFSQGLMEIKSITKDIQVLLKTFSDLTLDEYMKCCRSARAIFDRELTRSASELTTSISSVLKK